MRVLLNGLFARYPNTGTGEYLRRLVETFAAEGDLDVHIAAPANRPADADWLAPLAAARRVTVHPLPAPVGNAGKLLFEHVLFPALSVRLKPDVLHVPHFGPPLWSRGALVVTVHDLIMYAVPELAGSAFFRVYIRLAGWALQRARRVLADSICSARDIERFLGLPPERLRVVYLGVDAIYRAPVPATAVATVRARYQLPERYALYFGGLDWRKNVPALIRAYRASTLDLPLVVAGAAHSRNRAFYPDLAAAVGNDPRIRRAGYIADADKPALYAGARFFVYPSRYEGFGLPPLEAMAVGTPVLVSNRASLPEVTGDAALVVDPDDLAALTAALERLDRDEALRAQLQRAGPARAAQFTWSRTAAATRQAYEEAMHDTLRTVGAPAPVPAR